MNTATDATRPMVHDFTSAQCAQLARAAELYCKRLGGLEEKASTIKRSAEAAKYHREVEGLREELVGKLADAKHPGEALIYPRHRPVLATGIELLITNLRAAKGTLTPLGKADWIQELENEAEQVERELLPVFVDQLEMDVHAKKGDGLKAAAEEEAERTETELEQETKGLNRIGQGRTHGDEQRRGKAKGKK
jgi:outer membrane murein-binding lipoprotein Lpp